MTIRKGESEDMKSVLDLIQELATFEKQPDAVLVTVDDLKRDGFGTNPLFEVFIAEVKNNDGSTNILGIALYYYRYSTWNGRTIHLEDLIIKEEYRGKGIGYALYSEVIKQGKKDKVRRIEWNVLVWNKNAIDFYEKSGATILDEWKVAQMDEDGINNFLENKLKK